MMLLLLVCCFFVENEAIEAMPGNHTSTIGRQSSHTSQIWRRLLPSREKEKKQKSMATHCTGPPVREKESFRPYLQALEAMYFTPISLSGEVEEEERRQKEIEQTCIPQHLKCGWAGEKREESELPLYIFALGVEGSGHHLWESILEGVLDCNWVINIILLFL